MAHLPWIGASLALPMPADTLALLIGCALTIAAVLVWIYIPWRRDREEAQRLRRGDYQ